MPQTGSSLAANRLATHVARLSKSSLLKLSVIVVGILLVLVIGNIVFSSMAERKNPHRQFHRVRRRATSSHRAGDPVVPSVVPFRGNGSVIEDLIISGLVDRLARRNWVLCTNSAAWAPLRFLTGTFPLQGHPSWQRGKRRCDRSRGLRTDPIGTGHYEFVQRTRGSGWECRRT